MAPVAGAAACGVPSGPRQEVGQADQAPMSLLTLPEPLLTPSSPIKSWNQAPRRGTLARATGILVAPTVYRPARRPRQGTTPGPQKSRGRLQKNKNFFPPREKNFYFFGVPLTFGESEVRSSALLSAESGRRVPLPLWFFPLDFFGKNISERSGEMFFPKKSKGKVYRVRSGRFPRVTISAESNSPPCWCPSPLYGGWWKSAPSLPREPAGPSPYLTTYHISPLLQVSYNYLGGEKCGIY